MQQPAKVIVLAALISVAAVWAAYATGTWHESRMAETFAVQKEGEEEEEEGRPKGSGSSGREGFINVDAAQPGQSRKGAIYAEAFSQFFSSGSAAAIAASVANYLLYFQTTSADVSCDFAKETGSCRVGVDTLTCIDRSIKIPTDRRSRLDVASDNVSEVEGNACMVYVLGGQYRFASARLRSRLDVVKDSGGQGGPLKLVLPRCQYATRLLFLLRPIFVRLDDSALYRVDWAAAGTDGAAFTTAQRTSQVVLQLRRIMDPTIDPPALPGVPSRAFAEDTVRRASMGTSGLAGPTGSAQTAVTRGPYHTIQCYYLSFLKLNPMVVAGSPTSVATAYSPVKASINAAVNNSAGAAVLTLSKSPTGKTVTARTNGGLTLTVPAHDDGLVVATYSYDLLTLSCVSRSATTVARASNPGGAPLLYTPAPGAPVTSLCIPNVADLAIGTRHLIDAGDVGSSVGTAGGQTSCGGADDVEGVVTDTLKAGESMRAGERRMSANSKFVLEYQTDCNLVVYAAGSATWATNTYMPDVAPGRCEMGQNDGIVRLYDGDGLLYWESTKQSPPLVGGPYQLTLTDVGALEVVGTMAGGQNKWWSSALGPDPQGFPIMRTCAAASDAYVALHQAELSLPKYRGLTPWMHYVRVGKYYGWAWPGPECP